MSIIGGAAHLAGRGVRDAARFAELEARGRARAQQRLAQAQQGAGAARAGTLAVPMGTVAARPAGVVARRPAEPVRGDWLLNLADAWVGRHVHMRDAARHAVTLYAVAQHFRQPVQPCGTGAQQRIRMVMVWDKFGRIMLIAETPGSGKTTTMKVAGYLCAPYFQGILANPTAPGICLTIAHEDSLVCIDEAHRLIGSKGTRHADVITIACEGIEQDATHLNGRGGKANRVPIYAPMMIAGRDDLLKSAGEEIADLIDRSVVIRMTQPPEGAPELVPVTAKTKAGGALIAARIAQWATEQMADRPRFAAAMERARQAARDTGLSLRAVDVWLPMLTVAALADMDRAEALRAEDDELAADGYAVLAEDGHLIATCLAAIELRLRRPTAREDEDDPLRDLEASLLGDGALPSWGASAYSNEDEEPEQAEDDDLFTGIGEDDEEWPR